MVPACAMFEEFFFTKINFIATVFLLYRLSVKRVQPSPTQIWGGWPYPTAKMSANKQPFTEQVTKPRRSLDTARLGWIAAGILAVLLVVALLFWATAVGKLRGMESLRSKLGDANASLASALAESQKDQDQIAALQSQVADLEKEKEQAAQMAKGLEDEMRADLESKDVTISKLQGKLTVNILDRVMFDSGEAILKPDGETVMRKIAAILAGHPKLKIQVIGHTDNVPILRPVCQQLGTFHRPCAGGGAFSH